MRKVDSRFIGAHPEAAAVCEYLKAHGPSTSLEMKRDGIPVNRSIIMRMEGRGIVRRTGFVRIQSSLRIVWGLV